MQFDEKALQAVRERRFLIDRYDSWIIEEIKPFIGNRVIEIGCGLGNLTSHFVDRELIVGIETSFESVTEIKKRYANYKNVAVYEKDITDSSVLALKDMQFDSAISLNVFEHIDDDEIAMHHTAQLLQPNGCFTLIVPAHECLYGTMDVSIGHYRRYNKTLIREKLERAGLKVIYQKYMNMLGALGWFVNGRLFRNTMPPSGQLRLLNRILPAYKTLERMLPPLFGISLLTVAQSPLSKDPD